MRAARRLVLVLWADRWSIASAALMFGIAAVIVYRLGVEQGTWR